MSNSPITPLLISNIRGTELWPSTMQVPTVVRIELFAAENLTSEERNLALRKAELTVAQNAGPLRREFLKQRQASDLGIADFSHGHRGFPDAGFSSQYTRINGLEYMIVRAKASVFLPKPVIVEEPLKKPETPARWAIITAESVAPVYPPSSDFIMDTFIENVPYYVGGFYITPNDEILEISSRFYYRPEEYEFIIFGYTAGWYPTSRVIGVFDLELLRKKGFDTLTLNLYFARSIITASRAGRLRVQLSASPIEPVTMPAGPDYYTQRYDYILSEYEPILFEKEVPFTADINWWRFIGSSIAIEPDDTWGQTRNLWDVQFGPGNAVSITPGSGAIFSRR